jgi:uncharacterized protein YndB with AHSA1/START domain
MSETPELVFETELDAPPEKVWRAITVPEYLDRWLQPPADAELQIVAVEANNMLTYRLREPNQDSFVTIELAKNHEGGTNFRLTHTPVAANNNEPLPATLMLAA